MRAVLLSAGDFRYTEEGVQEGVLNAKVDSDNILFGHVVEKRGLGARTDNGGKCVDFRSFCGLVNSGTSKGQLVFNLAVGLERDHHLMVHSLVCCVGHFSQGWRDVTPTNLTSTACIIQLSLDNGRADRAAAILSKSPENIDEH